MEPFLYALDSIYGLLFLVAGVLAALQSRRDLRIARRLVVIGAAILVTRWGVWANWSDAPWLTRGLIGALIGGTLFVLVPGVLHWLSGRLAESGAPSPATITRTAFSETQSIKTLPPFLGGNEVLRLNNVATLRLHVPYSDSSITLVLDATPIKLPDRGNNVFSVQGAQLYTHDKNKEFEFDVGANKRREIIVGGRAFIVTLFEIKKLDTPNVTNPREYVFGISEK